jgi:hypothetical protein
MHTSGGRAFMSKRDATEEEAEGQGGWQSDFIFGIIFAASCLAAFFLKEVSLVFRQWIKVSNRGVL